MNKQIIIGSRGSELALIQSNEVKTLLQAEHPNLDIHIQMIQTRGDKILDKSISELGGKGLFTTEIEKCLLNHEIDLAVHSLKDLPSELDKGLKYVGSTRREDARDVLVSRQWDSLQKIRDGGIIATGSARRRTQILSVRPDLKLTNLRGNVDTRLRKLDENYWDGIIVAASAMHRLNRYDEITEYLAPNIHVPAPGQGALGLEIAEDRADMYELLKIILDIDTTLCCKAERAFLKKLDGGCLVPVGCHARLKGNTFSITGYVSDEDGTDRILKTLEGKRENSASLSNELAKDILKLKSRHISAK